jgi:hypothetical protein
LFDQSEKSIMGALIASWENQSLMHRNNMFDQDQIAPIPHAQRRLVTVLKRFGARIIREL